MGKHDEDATLREQIRAGIRAGTLPDRFPTFTWAGSGDGTQCVVCGLTVTGDEIEVEFELEADQGKSEGPFSMHPVCYKIWESTLLELRGHPMLGNRDSQTSIRRRG